ncbi:uncharacterized protein (TIGR03083 family) [Motilibacter peucedani]|uniref:Uncharacterized protein (TIGR03083 family) n=1 Tax=Motilibacter peucedani TaxID=598650 RepID=A0A420XQV3_9ACTN|nr:maleylpyruvate isomerase N-terminal domain-containing protein [Motilibacter peucedani]RKS75625.1 uncharacterized protein (TIGR03083 family) [Motilibacter peucedani]
MAPAEVLEDCWDRVLQAVAPLAPRDFLRPTLADGWCVGDLLFHLLLDAQRALVAFATPADGPPDTDLVSYWAPFRPGEGDGGYGHARFVRVSSSAYASPTTLVEHLSTTTRAALRAAAAADPQGCLETQGVVLSTGDFVATLVVEASVHHLDLVAHLPEAPAPSAGGLALVRRVLDGLLGSPLPTEWSDEVAALKGTGRTALDAHDRALLGTDSGKLPLFG